MSYERERISITNFLQGQQPKPFFGLSNFGLDGDDFKEANNSGYMTIVPGRANILSIAGDNLLVGVVSVLAITFFMAGSKGSSEARTLAQKIVDAFFDRNSTGMGFFWTFQRMAWCHIYRISGTKRHLCVRLSTRHSCALKSKVGVKHDWFCK